MRRGTGWLPKELVSHFLRSEPTLEVVYGLQKFIRIKVGKLKSTLRKLKRKVTRARLRLLSAREFLRNLFLTHVRFLQGLAALITIIVKLLEIIGEM